MAKKVAVVLFNLGGPKTAEDIQPFLKNLFRDKAIIRAPLPIRFVLARLISKRRAPEAAKNYAMMDAGGGSPLLPETEAQKEALQAELETAFAARGEEVELKLFIGMRYWHPFTEEAAAEVKAFGPDETVLLPLYPQFSTTTTGSSLTAWNKVYKGPTKTVCCYPFQQEFTDAMVARIYEAHERAGKPDNVKLLLSAHGLPESIVKAGDPYQWQCETFANMVAAQMPADWDVQVCYQSRVGPLKWIGPDTENEVAKASDEGKNILIAPIAFVSEHIETLVELGEEYRLVAEKHGAASYTRVEAVGTHPEFIKGLASEVLEALDMKETIRSCAGGRLCPPGASGCPQRDIARKAGTKVNGDAV